MLQKHTFKIQILTLSLLLSSGVAMANNTALASGAWEAGANWSSGSAPLATDMVVVPAGMTMTVNASGDVCGRLQIAATGAVIINNGFDLSIAGDFSNAGTFTAMAGSSLIFNGSANSTITGGGTYTIPGTVVMNMGSTATVLDVKDANFIAGINAGATYYLTFTRGTWKMNNPATLHDCYNSGSSTALTIPYGVVIEADAGLMFLAQHANTGNAILSGKLFVNGGTVNVQSGQGFNSGQDFQYRANGGTPQLYIASGLLTIGAGFNALTGSDYIDFHMTGGNMILALIGYSNWITFQLADVVGGKTFMSGGLIVLQDACNANIEDLDMGGANVAATQYSVTGGTVQLGYYSTQASSTYFGVDAQPATNYPNIDFEAGVPKNVSAFNGGNINMLSLYVNPNMTFDATGFPNVNIMGSNGTYAFDDEGGFIQANNTVTFSGSVPQVISSTSLANEIFYNLNIANTAGHVILTVPTTVTNQLTFTHGLLDASNYSLTVANGANAITGASSTNYIITGNGVTSTGQLDISNIPASTSTTFPVGTSTNYLPATLNPGINAGNSYSVFAFKGTTTNALANGPAFSAANKAKIVNAEWNITRTAGTGNASLDLDWSSSGTTLEGSSFQGYGFSIGIMQYSGGVWQSGTGSGNEATHTATSNFSSFSQFSVVGNAVLLPILLSEFDAVLNNNSTVLLSWSVSNSVGIQQFVVQKSINGTNWSSMGTVQANPDLTTESAYSLTDKNPASGVNYYRLKIQNFDGGYTYSLVKTVALSSNSSISVYPNPANNIINVSLGNTGSGMGVRLISPDGQILQSTVAGGSGSPVVSMNSTNYASGVYFLQVIGADKVIKTTSVLIKH
ncbi:MAG TPA: T9SS type A sorting domain-containing protein [Puia sp.]|nr:T9SS type A sorting domain-containing protein [Puia sp.]